MPEAAEEDEEPNVNAPPVDDVEEPEYEEINKRYKITMSKNHIGKEQCTEAEGHATLWLTLPLLLSLLLLLLNGNCRFYYN